MRRAYKEWLLRLINGGDEPESKVAVTYGEARELIEDERKACAKICDDYAAVKEIKRSKDRVAGYDLAEVICGRGLTGVDDERDDKGTPVGG